MDGRINAHRLPVGVLAGDAFIHLEQIAVAVADGVLPQPLDGIREIKINPSSAGANAAAFIASLLGRA